MKYVPKPGDSKKNQHNTELQRIPPIEKNDSQNIILKVVYGVTMT